MTIEKIFLDTNVILDFLLKRGQFAEATMRLFNASEHEKLQLYVSAISINNIHYIVSKLENKKVALEKVKLLLELVEIVSYDKVILEKSAYSDFKDFEDAIQNFSAEENGQSIIITRNIKDFKQSKLSIMTPIEFLTAYPEF